MLFEFRSRIERFVRDSLLASWNRFDCLGVACGKPFFGSSRKQGVSIRYALGSCAPTAQCSGGCYAHDGRDRHLHQIVRGAVNWYLGGLYEESEAAGRRRILQRLWPVLQHGVRLARDDQARAASLGVQRLPRIRFSHVGEMAAHPTFTNHLARAIKSIDPQIVCVVYTRHPRAIELDPEVLVVNFTLEGRDDPRRRLVPPFARVVASAWGGETVPGADVNFLEHHASYGVRQPLGGGFVCPVTLHHGVVASCDEAGCDVCFRVVRRQRTTSLRVFPA